MNRLLLSLASIAVLIANPGPLADQQTSPQQTPPNFRAGIDLVRLGVRVLDKQRLPVRGLTASDFSLLVDDVAQPIVTFAELSSPLVPAGGAAWTRSDEADVATNEGADRDRRLWTIVMDDCTLRPGFGLGTGKTVARQIVSSLGPSDKAAVVFTWNNRAAQDFTSNHAKLLAAIETFSPGPPPPFPCPSMRVLREVRTFLEELNNPRSAVAYLSIGGGSSEAAPDRRVVQTVPVYGFMLSGLVAPDLPLTGRVHLDEFSAKRSASSLRGMADDSGGVAVINTNTPERAVPQIFAENDSEYLLGYRPTYPLSDGRYRRLRIHVNRKDLIVEPSDRTFQTTPPPDLSKPVAPWVSLANALAGILPDEHSPLRVNVLPFANPSASGGSAIVAIAPGVQVPEKPATLTGPATLDLETVVFDSEGRKQISPPRTQRVDIPTAGMGRAYDFLSQLELKPGRYNLRFAMQGQALDAVGSVYTDVTVPDFAKDPLSLSGLVVAASSGPTAEPKTALASVMPVVPTTKREFESGDHVSTFLRIYQGGRSPTTPVTLRIDIVDETGGTVRSESEILAADRFATNRACDWQHVLAFGDLVTGRYLLTVSATGGGHTVSRELVFRLQR